MKTKLFTAVVGLIALLIAIYTFVQLDQDTNNLATGETTYLSFAYPSDQLVYSDGGFWTPEIAERTGTVASDTMPFIQIHSEPVNERTLEEIAIESLSLGDVVHLEDSPAFSPPFDEQNAFGHKTLNGRDVLWVRVADKFDLTTYYLEEGGVVHRFSTLFSDDETLQLVENLVSTVEVK